MFKKVIYGIIVSSWFVSALLGMEPEICPKFNSEQDINDFIHQLGTTAKPSGQEQQFSYGGKQWLIPQNSYVMLNGSISSENAKVVSEQTHEDYMVIDHIEFSKKEDMGQQSKNLGARCFYTVMGTGRKAGKPTTINSEFSITNIVQEQAAKSSVAANSINTGEKKFVAKMITTLGAQVHAFSNSEFVYQWDTFYQTPAYKEAKPGEQITDNFLVPQKDKSQLLVRVQITKENNEEESRRTQVQAAHKIQAMNVIKGKVAGVIFLERNGQPTYYGGFWRDHEDYKVKQPNERIQERFNIQKICGVNNGQPICINNVSDVVIRKAANNWQLPIFETIIHYKTPVQITIVNGVGGGNVNAMGKPAEISK